MSVHHSDSSAPSPRLHRLRIPRLRMRLTFSHLWRSFLVALMSLTFVLASYSTLVPNASAASHASMKPPPHKHPPKPILAPAKPLAPLTSHQKAFAASPNVSSSMPFDGLGQLPFFTYVKHAITSTSCTCGKKELLINVSNGNLLLHSVEMRIKGTAGLDLDIEAYYNSLATYSRDLGQNWNFSLGHDAAWV